MCKRLICLTTFVLIFILVGSTSGELIVHWKLDEGSGTTVRDWSGHGYDTEFTGAPEWVEGYHGGALNFNGSGDSVIYRINPEETWPTYTVAVWAKADVISQSANSCIFANHMTYATSTPSMQISYDSSDNYQYHGPVDVVLGPASLDWVHLCVVGEGSNVTFYYDGNLVTSVNHSTGDTVFSKIAIGVNRAEDNWFDGSIDDLRVYNHALLEHEVLSAMQNEPQVNAFSPSPADGALQNATWVNLSWLPGELAVSHDVYLGENFDDVNDATRDSDIFQGNQTATFLVAGFPGFAYPDGLVPGTTYFWRIDEVNDVNPDSPWKGKVWSFTVASKKAYNPNPPDGTNYMSTDVDLSWTPGLNAIIHYVYFGNNFDEVYNATVGLTVMDATYDPGPLTAGTTYYWRVDEFDGSFTHKGDVWSFTTIPAFDNVDPNLICWWKLDEGEGTRVIDWSGNGCDADFKGTPLWVDGYDGGALNFNGITQSVTYLFSDTTMSAYTVAVWAKADVLWQSNNSSICATYLTTNGGFQFSFDASNNYQYHADVDQIIGPASLGWEHLTVTYDGTIATAYYNGEVTGTFTPAADDLVMNKYALGINRAEDNWFDGSVDDFRVYDRALSQEETQYIMRGDRTVAWHPSPASGSNPDIDAALPLSWSPGDNASQHDVYFGLDKDALKAADSSDTTDIYRGRQNATTYTPPEGVEWGGGPYYWRIDEVNTDGTISTGRIWSFTVADFILVDDFESYTDDDINGEAIWQHWIDGFGVVGNGSQVGNLLPPYAEQTIVHSGNQSMPLFYDNTAGVTNSEAVLTLIAPRDWTRHGLTDLSLWFRGYPASVGSFIESPVGTYTMTGSGADIWNTADAFHYAYKTLTGPGSIVARVNSVSNTHVWAKAGVMIRETLDAGSKHAFACVTPGSGVAFQLRTDTDVAMTGTTEAGITAPHWVKVERDVMGNFTVTHSTNGTAWQAVASAVPVNIPMTSNVYIGLALTSHDAAATCQAVFSNVTTTGNVSGQWAHQDVGITSNAAEPMYVALSNKNGVPAVAAHEDPAAATIDTWTEWRIPLQAFADQGINLVDVDSIAIGLGSQSGIASSGGSGTMYIDDIRLYPPAQEPEPEPQP